MDGTHQHSQDPLTNLFLITVTFVIGYFSFDSADKIAGFILKLVSIGSGTTFMIINWGLIVIRTKERGQAIKKSIVNIFKKKKNDRSK